jgi:hypothetical protein
MLYKSRRAILAPDPAFPKTHPRFRVQGPFSLFNFPNVLKHESRIFAWILDPSPVFHFQSSHPKQFLPSRRIFPPEFQNPSTSPPNKIYSASHLVNHIVHQNAGTLNLVRIVTFVIQEQSISTSSLRLRNPASPKSMPPEADSRFISYPHPPKAMLPEADSRPVS